MEYRLIISKELSERDSAEAEAVRKYWEYGSDQGKFILNLKDIAKETGIKYERVGTLATKYAYCEIAYGFCEGCGQELLIKARNRQDFIGLLYKFQRTYGCFDKTQLINKLCSSCYRDVLIKQQEEAQAVRELELRPHYDRMKEALSKEPWWHLSESQFEVLKGVVLSQSKANIRKYVFRGNFYDKQTWALVGALERANLIWVERKNGSVEMFHFVEELKTLLPPFNYIAGVSQSKNNVLLDSNTPAKRLRLDLTKNNNRERQQQPHYSFRFTVPEGILLRAGETMSAGIWENSDGHLSLYIQPLNSIGKVIPTVIGKAVYAKDPQSIKDIIPKFFKNEDDEPPF